MRRQIAFLTDAHLSDSTALELGINPEENLVRALNDISERNIKEVIYGGDIGKNEKYTTFFKLLSDFDFKLILGNHDKYEDVVPYFEPEKDMDELFYLEEDDSFRFIFMDSSSGKISDKQLQWLEQKIDTDKAIILFIHHPVLDVETAMDKKYPLRNRDKIRTILTDSKKEISIFCGHYHMSEERKVDNLTQYITHAVSFQIEKEADDVKTTNSPFGYRIINLEEQKVQTELIHFSQKKHCLSRY